MSEEKNEKKIERTSLGLRNGLFDEWDRLIVGQSTAQRVSALARLATTIDNSIKTEIEYQKHVQNLIAGKEKEAIPPNSVLQLGSDD